MPIERPPNDRRMFGLLREIRAGARFLQNAADDALSQASKLGPREHDASLPEALDTVLLDRIDAVISGRLSEIRRVFAEDVTEYEWCADPATTIRADLEERPGLVAPSDNAVRRSRTPAPADRRLFGPDCLPM
jgi:hypothetical protein